MAVRNSKPDPAAVKTLVLPDGGGLRLTVTPAGSKYWQYRTAVGGKETTAQIGEYPTMSLAVARQRANELRMEGRAGRNPVTVHKAAKLENRVQAVNTFEGLAKELLVIKKADGISDSHYNKVVAGFSTNLYPSIGSLPIQSISSAMLVEALRPMEARGALEYLSGVRRWAGEVFDYAKAHGKFSGDNPAHALRKNIFKKHKGHKMPALPWSEMGNFQRGLGADTGEVGTVAAMRLLILTAVRPSELLAARWEEFDLDRARWEIPAERMKKRQMHAVPLSRQVVGQLRELKLHSHGEFLFPRRVGSKHATLPKETIRTLICRVTKVSATAHGFRSTFSTHVSESLKWDDKVKEACLAHARGGKIEGTYDRATFYAERTKLMQWYADEIDVAVKGAEVIPIRNSVV
jgi:integrase